ncbi:MAG: hypothetical protein JNL60_18060 [Bacteroidia bacterium]|nr:hypothetical protein [Bacteroidia bacterium]
MSKSLVVINVLLFLLFVSCKQKENPDENKGTLIAKAGDENYSVEEFKQDYITTGTIKDSTYNSKKVIEKWATESLFYQEAIKRLNAEEISVDKQVEEYRRSLINYIYQSRLIEANLDTTVSREEIEDYYNNHRDNFILSENIVKVNYLKVPVTAQVLPKIKKLVWAVTEKDKQLLKDLCAQNAENFFMNDSTWLYLDDVKKEIPALRDQPDFNLSMGRVVEFSDDQYYYYLKVRDIKVKNGLSPINFEYQNIKRFIINNRKTQLISEYKKTLLEKAKSDKKFSVY